MDQENQNAGPNLAAQVQNLASQNLQLQGQLTQLLTNSTLKANETRKPDAYLAILHSEAATCPISGRALEFPQNLSKQMVKFIIEDNWQNVATAFTRPGGFRDLKTQYN